MVTAWPVRPPTVKAVLAILRRMSSPDRVGNVGARPGEPARAQSVTSPLKPSPPRPLSPSRTTVLLSLFCVLFIFPTVSCSFLYFFSFSLFFFLFFIFFFFFFFLLFF